MERSKQRKTEEFAVHAETSFTTNSAFDVDHADLPQGIKDLLEEIKNQPPNRSGKVDKGNRVLGSHW